MFTFFEKYNITEKEYFNDPVSIGFRIGFSFIIFDSLNSNAYCFDSKYSKFVSDALLVFSSNLKISLKHFNLNFVKYANLVSQSFVESVHLKKYIDSELSTESFLVVGQEIGFNVGLMIFGKMFSHAITKENNDESFKKRTMVSTFIKETSGLIIKRNEFK